MKIGFYDSGLGGIKTLKDIIEMGLSNDILFLADTKNCPYGIKEEQLLIDIIDNNIKYLIKNDCKIIVIACNTATSVAINYLRDKYKNITFIGTEPAVKVALAENHKKIIVMGTTRTIKGNKLKELVHNNKDIYLVTADKLVTLIENNKDNREYVKELFSKFNMDEVSHIVLGCTHYSIIKNDIQNIVGSNIHVIDGNIGIGNNLLNKIKQVNKLSIKIIMSEYNTAFENNVKKIMGTITYEITSDVIE